jgi:nicotinate-nucleotide adenylyltransferase
MRIGLFGGTFDPIHLGHLILAERCREEAGLQEIWFLPSYVPPHKTERTITRFEQRCEMVALATTGQPAFRVERIEKELPPPSFTSETLAELQERHPDNQFSLVIGGDSLRDFATWHNPQKVLELASLVAVPRPGANTVTAEELATQLGLPVERVRLKLVECPAIDIASREIRARVAAGKTIRFLVPRSIEEYVRERKLYAAPV